MLRMRSKTTVTNLSIRFKHQIDGFWFLHISIAKDHLTGKFTLHKKQNDKFYFHILFEKSHNAHAPIFQAPQPNIPLFAELWIFKRVIAKKAVMTVLQIITVAFHKNRSHNQKHKSRILICQVLTLQSLKWERFSYMLTFDSLKTVV